MSIQRPTHVILGVTGGIAAYKSPDIVRRLRSAGCEVQVIMTEAAKKLVATTVFQAVSGRPVRDDLWDEAAESAMGHIELARWADLVLVAPATANTMADFAAGSANSLLTTVCLATPAPVALAPAMNQQMWRNPATQANAKVLQARGVRLIGPAEGEQACGDVGPGRMAEPLDIVTALLAIRTDAGSQSLAGRRVLITAGPTREPIDPVRFVSNRSSGKMGFAVAAAAANAGAQVTLIAGPVTLATPMNVDRVDVETSQQMHAATIERAGQADIYIGAAAIADYRPVSVPDHKIKKKADTIELSMIKSVDVLAAVASMVNAPFAVGFAAETQKLEEHALKKLENKKLDMIIGNLVGHNLCFDRDDNSVLVLWPNGKKSFDRMPKAELAEKLIELIADRYAAATNAPTPIRRQQAVDSDIPKQAS